MKLKFDLQGSPFLSHKEYWLVAVILGCFWAFGIGSTYGFSIFPDEFAYWTYAASTTGYDWSDIVSLASYYSYGYSLILIPIFALFEDVVVAYRVAVSLNFIFLFIGFLTLTKTMKRMVSDERIPIILFSALPILMPCNLFYTQMTLTEVFLVSLYIAAGSMLLHYLENNRVSTLLALMLTLMYLYTVHMRTVGILIAAMAVLSIHILPNRNKRWHIIVVIGVTLILFVAASWIKQQMMVNVYGDMGEAVAAENDYSGQVAKIQYIFTKDGFYDFIISVAGKVLYLGLATWGLFYWGMYALLQHVVRAIHNLRRGVPASARQLWALFALLSVISQIVIATIYLLTLGEMGDYTYGRYTEMILPFVMVYGLVVLWKERAGMVWIVTGFFAVIQMVLTYLITRQIIALEAGNFQGYFMVGISYLYEEKNFQVETFYAGAYLLCEFLTLIVTAAVLFCRKEKKRQNLILLFMVMELGLAMHADQIYLEPFKRAAFRDSRMVDKIESLQEEGRRVVYMENEGLPYIGIIQFMAKDLEIQVMAQRESESDYGKDLTAEDILIFAFDDTARQEWEEKYAQVDIYGHFALVYND